MGAAIAMVTHCTSMHYTDMFEIDFLKRYWSILHDGELYSFIRCRRAAIRSKIPGKL
jgi:NO-binding membrane sensor protein with MHYT domain